MILSFLLHTNFLQKIWQGTISDAINQHIDIFRPVGDVNQDPQSEHDIGRSKPRGALGLGGAGRSNHAFAGQENPASCIRIGGIHSGGRISVVGYKENNELRTRK